MHDVLDPRDVIADEYTQREESGYDVAALRGALEAALADGPGAALEALLAQLEAAPRVDSWPYHEPSDLPGILASLRQPAPLDPLGYGDDELYDRILAAWLGRCAGCNLGKPFEGVTREQIRAYLTAAAAYPLDDYVPVLDPMPEGIALNPSWTETTRGRIAFMARDDDTDYTILALHILEVHGFDYTAEDVAREWLSRLPFLQVYTAERAAYRNLVLGVPASDAARVRNPWREWIGAQIRADMFGYVSPGQPLRAARLAFADASLSHVANGIYGAMWAAGLIAACFSAGSARQALDAAAAVVPPRSRLTEALALVDAMHAEGLDWETARDRLETELGALSWVHTINNAALVAMALLWGDGDFTATIGLAVQGGWDTDCNGATAGSAFGALHGSAALPRRWVEPLNDRIRSALFGYEDSRVSDLAGRTHALARAQMSAPAEI